MTKVPDALSIKPHFTYRSWQICWMGAYCHWRLAWCDTTRPFLIISSWVPESSLGKRIARLKLFALRQSCLICFNSFLLFFHVFPTWCALRPLPWFLWRYGGGDIGRPWLMSQHNGSWASSGEFYMGLQRFPFLGGGFKVISPWFGEGSYLLVHVWITLLTWTYVYTYLYILYIYMYGIICKYYFSTWLMDWKAPLFEVSGSQVGMCRCLGVGGHGYITSSWVRLVAFYWNCWCDKTVTVSSDGMLVCHCFEMDGPKVHHLPLASEKMM